MLEKTRQKHDYTSELELKSLLIRLQLRNKLKLDDISEIASKDHCNNRKINRYIKLFIKLKNCEFEKQVTNQKVSRIRKELKELIVKLSEKTPISDESYERFGEIILLMIKSILTKHQFSGYSYKDDFYSDSIHKILKYMKNFNHKLISKRTGLEVNAFAYISQIIHNSVIYIIKQNKKAQDDIKGIIFLEINYGEFDLKNHSKENNSSKMRDAVKEVYVINVSLDELSLKDIIEEINTDVAADEKLKHHKYILKYPKSHIISFEEYNELSPLLKGNIDIVRSVDE